MDNFVCVNFCTMLPFWHNEGCSVRAQQSLETVNNVWVLFSHVDKFAQASWCAKNMNIFTFARYDTQLSVDSYTICTLWFLMILVFFVFCFCFVLFVCFFFFDFTNFMWIAKFAKFSTSRFEDFELTVTLLGSWNEILLSWHSQTYIPTKLYPFTIVLILYSSGLTKSLKKN